MAKTLYDGVNGVCRKTSKKYDGVNAVSRQIKKAYDGVNAISRLYYENLYYWYKYVSKRTGTRYNSYQTKSTYLTIQIWRPQEYTGVIEYVDTWVDGHIEYNLIAYSGFSYSTSNGSFTPTGKSVRMISTFMSLSNYVIETDLVGKYIYYEGSIYKITGHNDVYSLICKETYVAGSRYYTYSYSLDSEVSSENPNAYPNESISSYTSTSSNDIRTKYVKKT